MPESSTTATTIDAANLAPHDRSFTWPVVSSIMQNPNRHAHHAAYRPVLWYDEIRRDSI